mgnify:FL=1
MRALRKIVRTAKAHNKPVSLCGELASQPIGALVLLAIGYRALSLTPTAPGPIKAMILDLALHKAEKLINGLIDQPTGSVSIRDEVRAFAEAEGLAL